VAQIRWRKRGEGRHGERSTWKKKIGLQFTKPEQCVLSHGYGARCSYFLLTSKNPSCFDYKSKRRAFQM
jgi:hypothetical protein